MKAHPLALIRIFADSLSYTHTHTHTLSLSLSRCLLLSGFLYARSSLSSFSTSSLTVTRATRSFSVSLYVLPALGERTVRKSQSSSPLPKLQATVYQIPRKASSFFTKAKFFPFSQVSYKTIIVHWKLHIVTAALQNYKFVENLWEIYVSILAVYVTLQHQPQKV